MRKILMLCGAILALSMTAAAQDSTETLAAPSPAGAPGAPKQSSSVDEFNRQISINYEFVDFRNVHGLSFHGNGVNVDFNWYFKDWLGFEVNESSNFGTTPLKPFPDGISDDNVFIGGGIRYGYRRKQKLEPWAHAIVGLQEVIFTQVTTGIGHDKGLGYVLGGGIDYKLAPRLYLQVEGDYLGTHLASANQNNFKIDAGVAFNF
jgi:opacity protein-like surface antigen